MNARKLLPLLTALLAITSFTASAVTQYKVTQLYAPCNYPHPKEANLSNLGHVVGEWCIDGYSRSYIWQNGSAQDLGLLGGGACFAEDVNSSGVVVGGSHAELSEMRAFIWEDRTMTDLGTLGGYSSKALGINSSGLIVGYAGDSDGNIRPCYWEKYTAFDLETLGGDDGIARGVNDLGEIVGEADVKSGEYHAFLYRNGVMEDLGVFGGESSKALGINNNTQIIGGLVDLSGVWQSWVWEDGEITFLGSLGGGNSTPTGINNLGQVVGGSGTADYDWHAFIWENEVMYDLNDYIPENSGWELDAACAINDSGWIVGYGTLKGETCAFLLTPVPEPVSFGLAIAGLVAFLLRRALSSNRRLHIP